MACSACQQLADDRALQVQATLRDQNAARKALSEARMRRGLIFAGAALALYFVLR